jgi:signal transduction histidine kinase
MRELSSACVVVDSKLTVLHANKMARKFFLRGQSRAADMEFSDLPQVLGAKVYQVLNTGSALSSFRYEPENAEGTIYSISIVPFQRQPGGLPSSVLMVADDLTQTEHYKKLEIEAANNRQLKSMADRLTAELGNAVTRLSTYQQLLSEKLNKKSIDTEFLKLMEHDWADDMKRITRFVSQLRYLNVDSVVTYESFGVESVLEEAFQEARKYLPAKNTNLTVESPVKQLKMKGDRAAMKLALTEILLNAIQANPAEPKLCVRLGTHVNGSGPALLIEVQDNGPGFSPDLLNKVSLPFFTTRVVGLGLGLTVSRKIIETHQGKLEIVPRSTSAAGVVRIVLPNQE